MSKNEVKMHIEMFIEDELRICKHQYQTTGGCKFNNGIRCESCGAIPLMVKMLNGKVNHEASVKELLSKLKF